MCSSTVSSGSRQDCRPSNCELRNIFNSKDFNTFIFLLYNTIHILDIHLSDPKQVPYHPQELGLNLHEKNTMHKRDSNTDFWICCETFVVYAIKHQNILMKATNISIKQDNSPTKAWLSGGTETAWVAMAAAGLREGSLTAKETPWEENIYKERFQEVSFILWSLFKVRQISRESMTRKLPWHQQCLDLQYLGRT